MHQKNFEASPEIGTQSGCSAATVSSAFDKSAALPFFPLLHHPPSGSSAAFASSAAFDKPATLPLFPLLHRPRPPPPTLSTVDPNPNCNPHHHAISSHHKRPIASPTTLAGSTIADFATSVRRHNPHRHRLTLCSVTTCNAFRHLLRLLRVLVLVRVRLLLLLSFPFLYLLLSSTSSISGRLSARSFFLEFISAVAFSSLLLILLVFLNVLPVPPSIRLLLSRSSAFLLPRYHLPRYKSTATRVLWSIGGSNKTNADQSPTLGSGVHAYSNGDVYEGEFHKGKCSGSGVYHYYMSGRYEGDWIDDKYDGYGVETWARGSRYRGQYRKGLRHGNGVYSFHTGDVYSGQWLNGQSHGYGVHTCKDGSRYVGEFKWGVKHGLGHYHLRNGDTYGGEYFADKMHGLGVYCFANGHRYEGSWHESKRQGLGQYTFQNGETQSGHWQNGVLDILSTQSTLPGLAIAVNHSKVLNAVQEARRTSEKAYAVQRVDDRVNKAVTAANKAANAARVAAIKAIQKRIPSNYESILPVV